MEQSLAGMLHSSSLDIPTPPAFIEGERSGDLEQVAPGELERLKNNWQQAIYLTGKSNLAMLDRDYATEDQVQKDLKKNKPDDEEPTDDEVRTELEKRREKQEKARETDPEKIVKQDGPFKGKSPEDADVQQEAARRKALIKAFDEILYPIHDCMNAAEQEAERAVKEALEKKIQDEIKEKLDELKREPSGFPGQQKPDKLSDEQEEEIRSKAQLDPEIAETIRQDVIRRYYDAELGTYYRLDDDGQPTTEIIPHGDSFATVVAELEQIASLHAPDNSPTEEAKRAKELIDSLAYDAEQNKFRVLSVKEMREKVETEAEEFVINTACAKLEDLLGDAKSQEDVIVRDNDGEISINREALNRLDLETTGRLGLLLATYYDLDPNTPRGAKARKILSSYILSELASCDKDSIKQLGENVKIFQERINAFQKRIVERYLHSYSINMPDYILKDNNLLNFLFLSHACKGKITVKDNRLALPSGATEILECWDMKTPADKKTVISFVQTGVAEDILKEELGFDMEALDDKKMAGIYAKRAVKAIEQGKEAREEQPLENSEKEEYEEILKHILNNESLRKIAKDRNFPELHKLGLIGFLIFAPSLQQLMNIGVEEGGQGQARH